MGKVSLAPKVEAELSRLRIDKAEFLKDYPSIKNAVDANPALVEGWKVVESDKILRTDIDVLEKIVKYERNPDNFTSFGLLANDFKLAKDKKAWLKGLDDEGEVNVVVKPKGNDVDLITSSNPKKQRRITTAVEFLKKMGKDNDQINRIVGTIDLSRGVSVDILKKGNKVWRYERTVNKSTDGHFFTDAYGAAYGVKAVGFESPQGYELVTYEVINKTSVLRTKIKDTGHTQYISSELQNYIKEISREPAKH